MCDLSFLPPPLLAAVFLAVFQCLFLPMFFELSPHNAPAPFLPGCIFSLNIPLRVFVPPDPVRSSVLPVPLFLCLVLALPVSFVFFFNGFSFLSAPSGGSFAPVAGGVLSENLLFFICKKSFNSPFLPVSGLPCVSDFVVFVYVCWAVFGCLRQ